jgi:hypothetical protein
MPVAACNTSNAKCGVLPWPAEAQLILPGLAYA